MGQELRRRLWAVDPELKIVPGGQHRHNNKAGGDWEKAAGVVCSNCHHEVYRSRDGRCFPCWEKEHEFEIRDKEGVLALLPQSVIMSIVRPSRKEKEEVSG